jgi:hypothetical protein
MKRQVYLQCCAIVAMVMSISGVTNAARPKYISLGISELVEHDQTVSYSLRSEFLSPVARTESLVGPAGQIFGPFPGTQLRFSSGEELVANIAGDWTFTSTSKGNPADVEQYGFTISPFQYGGLAPPVTPTISPLNHSFVSSPFTVTWDPPSSSYSYGASGIANVVGRLIEPGKLEISFGKTLYPGAYLSFGQSPGQSLNEYVSVTDGPANDPEYELALTMFFSRQVEFQYYPTGVPEPSGLVMAILGGLAIRSGRQARPSDAAHLQIPR